MFDPANWTGESSTRRDNRVHDLSSSKGLPALLSHAIFENRCSDSDPDALKSRVQRVWLKLALYIRSKI